MENDLDFNRDLVSDDEWCSVVEGPEVTRNRTNGRFLLQNPLAGTRKVLGNPSLWCEVLSDHAYPLRIGSHLSSLVQTTGILSR